ncbi:RNA polymerase sigma factor [Actinomadura luteofluorescens]|uniref:RNA polymerase sigma factor n=1 Tax=Actinomadura luteofluorescens TaxID=46163 RepID=UPI00363D80DD
MGGDLGSLYDAHADRLYAYCWSLVGDQLAAAAVGDTFSAAVHQPPRGDSVLWLYSLSRTACAERGAFTGEPGLGAAAGRGPLFAAPTRCCAPPEACAPTTARCCCCRRANGSNPTTSPASSASRRTPSCNCSTRRGRGWSGPSSTS